MGSAPSWGRLGALVRRVGGPQWGVRASRPASRCRGGDRSLPGLCQGQGLCAGQGREGLLGTHAGASEAPRGEARVASCKQQASGDSNSPTLSLSPHPVSSRPLRPIACTRLRPVRQAPSLPLRPFPPWGLPMAHVCVRTEAAGCGVHSDHTRPPAGQAPGAFPGPRLPPFAGVVCVGWGPGNAQGPWGKPSGPHGPAPGPRKPVLCGMSSTRPSPGWGRLSVCKAREAPERDRPGEARQETGPFRATRGLLSRVRELGAGPGDKGKLSWPEGGEGQPQPGRLGRCCSCREWGGRLGGCTSAPPLSQHQLTEHQAPAAHGGSSLHLSEGSAHPTGGGESPATGHSASPALWVCTAPREGPPRLRCPSPSRVPAQPRCRPGAGPALSQSVLHTAEPIVPC